MIEIYTDGSARPNPGPGGYGVVVYKDGERVKVHSKHFPQTTNNEMELSAILWAAINYGDKDNPPVVYSDSAYAINCLLTWSDGWCKNGWTRPKDQKIENLELIKAFYENFRGTIDLRKCSGHAGIEGNELADKLARTLCKKGDNIL